MPGNAVQARHKTLTRRRPVVERVRIHLPDSNPPASGVARRRWRPEASEHASQRLGVGRTGRQERRADAGVADSGLPEHGRGAGSGIPVFTLSRQRRSGPEHVQRQLDACRRRQGGGPPPSTGHLPGRTRPRRLKLLRPAADALSASARSRCRHCLLARPDRPTRQPSRAGAVS